MLALTQTLRHALIKVFEPEFEAWSGLQPLGKVFWGYGVVASSVLAALYGVAVYEGRLAVQQGLLVFFAGYTVWILVAVWRCAGTADPHWGLIARCLTVAWAINAAMVATFLQVELIATYLGW